MLFEAIFKPSDKSLYNDEARKHTNSRVALHEGWIAKEGPFLGQQCFYVPNSTVGVLPMNDLQELRPVSTVKWNEIHKNMGYA